MRLPTTRRCFSFENFSVWSTALLIALPFPHFWQRSTNHIPKVDWHRYRLLPSPSGVTSVGWILLRFASGLASSFSLSLSVLFPGTMKLLLSILLCSVPGVIGGVGLVKGTAPGTAPDCAAARLGMLPKDGVGLLMMISFSPLAIRFRFRFGWPGKELWEVGATLLDALFDRGGLLGRTEVTGERGGGAKPADSGCFGSGGTPMPVGVGLGVDCVEPVVLMSERW